METILIDFIILPGGPEDWTIKHRIQDVGVDGLVRGGSHWSHRWTPCSADRSYQEHKTWIRGEQVISGDVSCDQDSNHNYALRT